MLRYLAHGKRDLASSPIGAHTRFNWEFYAQFEGVLRPTGARLSEVRACGKPRLWVFPPDVPHGWEAEGEVDRAVFHFSSVPDIVREASAGAGYLSVELSGEDCRSIRQLADSLDAHYRTPSPLSVLHFDRALADLSLIALRDTQVAEELPLETVAFERVERVIEWYLSHLHERPTLDALAEVVHVSVAHLRRQFRLVYNRSPHDVLTHLRLEKAAQLLATTDGTLEQVASKSGFNSSSDLCRVFKRRYKVYPNEWRMQLAGMERPRQQRERLIARLDPAAAEMIANRWKPAKARKRGRAGRSR